MKPICNKSDGSCEHYISDFNIGFKIVTPMKGDHYTKHKHNYHSLVFLIQGEVEFSYNDFLNRRFNTGHLFFIPQASEMYGRALTDAKMLVLSFNNKVESLCEKSRLTEYTKKTYGINYDFKPLQITDTLNIFVKLMEDYLIKDFRCSFLHEIKQKELFLLLGAEYRREDLYELFYPISETSADFKIKVTENYRTVQNVSELADRLGMSYSPFLRQFKKEFGESVKEWMLKQKAKHIRLRLSVPSTTISDIVRDFHFTDLSHFIRFCHKQYGCTPKELYNKIKNDEANKTP